MPSGSPCHLPPSLGTAGSRRVAPARTTLGTARSSRKKKKKKIERGQKSGKLVGSRLEITRNNRVNLKEETDFLEYLLKIVLAI